jgi:hypothetical protein
MRLSPQRRGSIIFATVAGMFFTANILRRAKVPLDESFVAWVVVGGVGAGVLVTLLVLLAVRGDTRRAILERQFPDAVVVQSWPEDSLLESLRALTPWIIERVPYLITATFVFDANHVTAWAGGRSPIAVARIPWADVTAFGIAPRFKKLDRIQFTAFSDGDSYTVVFPIERAGKYTMGNQMLDEAALGDIVDRVNTLRRARNRAVTVAPDAAASDVNRLNAMLYSGLLSGPTAQSYTKLVALSKLPLALVFYIIGSTGAVLATIPDLRIQAVLISGFGLLGPLLGFLGRLVQRRAITRERSGGYTTLNGRELDLQQRHPRTGTVLRHAGQPPLSEKEFDALGW